jgi:hypothetical protein
VAPGTSADAGNAGSGLREQPITVAPSTRSWREIPTPTPRLVPVTTAILPSSSPNGPSPIVRSRPANYKQPGDRLPAAVVPARTPWTECQLGRLRTRGAEARERLSDRTWLIRSMATRLAPRRSGVLTSAEPFTSL